MPPNNLIIQIFTKNCHLSLSFLYYTKQVGFICQKDLLGCYFSSKIAGRKFASRNQNSRFANLNDVVETRLVEMN